MIYDVRLSVIFDIVIIQIFTYFLVRQAFKNCSSDTILCAKLSDLVATTFVLDNYINNVIRLTKPKIFFIAMSYLCYNSSTISTSTNNTNTEL